MDSNLLIQYIVTGVLVLAALIWIIIKFVKMAKGKTSGCPGCALSERCTKPEKSRKQKKSCCSSGTDKPCP